MMSRGRICSSINGISAFPARNASRSFAADTAGLLASKGSDMPIASMAELMVLAVYMPPHEPAPRHAAGGPHAFTDLDYEAVEMSVAGRDVAVKRRDADHGPVEVAIVKADGAEHGPVWGAAHSAGGDETFALCPRCHYLVPRGSPT